MTSWLYNCLWQTLHLQPLILSKFTITAGHGRNLCRKTRHISKKINLDVTHNKVIMFSNGTTCYKRQNVMSQSLHQQSALILISTFQWLSPQKDENLFLWIFWGFERKSSFFQLYIQENQDIACVCFFWNEKALIFLFVSVAQRWL